jgi:hypothetical protein
MDGRRGLEFVDGAKRRGQTALSARRSDPGAFAEGMVVALGQSGQSPFFAVLSRV